jgi:nucleotide-binding universal stress UspA family protein
MFGTVLIGLALDARDAFLLDACVSIVAPLGVQRVVMAHVRRHDRLPAELLGELEPHPGAEAHTRLHDLAEQLRLRLPGLEVIDVYGVGNPSEEILKIAEIEGADLLLLGRFAQPAESPDKGVLGRDILRHAACTTLVVPEGHTPALGHAVVGVDFSHCSVQALSAACSLYARVTPVFSYHLAPGLAYGGLTHEASRDKLVQGAREHYQTQLLPTLASSTAQIEPLKVVESERASDGLLAVTAEIGADAIVMGGHGRTRLAAVLLGSTAERIAVRAPVPVLVVRDKAERLGLLASLIHR